MKQDKIAEEMAVYAYFFLVMTVVLQIVEYIKEGRKEKKKKKEEDIPKKEPLLLSEKIELLIGDPDSFVKEVERAEKQKEKRANENDIPVDRDESVGMEEGEAMEIETVEVVKDEDEKNKISMKIGIKDKTVLRSAKALMVTVRTGEKKEKRVGEVIKRRPRKKKSDPGQE